MQGSKLGEEKTEYKIYLRQYMHIFKKKKMLEQLGKKTIQNIIF